MAEWTKHSKNSPKKFKSWKFRLVHVPNKTVHRGNFIKIHVACMHDYPGLKSTFSSVFWLGREEVVVVPKWGIFLPRKCTRGFIVTAASFSTIRFYNAIVLKPLLLLVCWFLVVFAVHFLNCHLSFFQRKSFIISQSLSSLSPFLMWSKTKNLD